MLDMRRKADGALGNRGFAGRGGGQAARGPIGPCRRRGRVGQAPTHPEVAIIQSGAAIRTGNRKHVGMYAAVRRAVQQHAWRARKQGRLVGVVWGG